MIPDWSPSFMERHAVPGAEWGELRTRRLLIKEKLKITKDAVKEFSDYISYHLHICSYAFNIFFSEICISHVWCLRYKWKQGGAAEGEDSKEGNWKKKFLWKIKLEGWVGAERLLEGEIAPRWQWSGSAFRGIPISLWSSRGIYIYGSSIYIYGCESLALPGGWERPGPTIWSPLRGLGFLGGTSGKESACSAGGTGDPCSIPRSGRSPGEGHGNPLQYSGLENLMDRGSWRLQSMGSQRVGHDWSDLSHMHRGSSLVSRRPGGLSLVMSLGVHII